MQLIGKNKSFLFLCVLLFFHSDSIHATQITIDDNFGLISKWTYETDFISPIDIDGDNIDELYVNHGEQIDIQDIFRLVHYESFPTPNDRMYGFKPLQSGSLDSIAFLAHYSTPDSSIFKLMIKRAGERIVMKDYFAFTGHDKNGDGNFHLDIRAEGYLNNGLLIFVLNSGFDCAERGIMAVEPTSGEIVWKFLMGPQVHNLNFADVNNDGEDDVVIGTYAPDNGAIHNGTRDDASYIFVINNQGKLMWRKRIGPHFTGVFPSIGDVDGDGEVEIVAYCYGTNPDFDKTNLLNIYNARDGKLINSGKIGNSFAPYNSTNRSICHDLNDDGIDEIIVGNTDGTIRKLDEDLNLIDVSKPFKIPVDIVGVGDMDLNGTNEVIVMTADDRLVILDNNLKFLCQRSMPTKTRYKIVHDRNKIYILSIHKLESIYSEFGLIELQNTNYRQYFMSNRHSILIYIIFIVLITLFLYYVRNLFYGREAKELLISFLETSELTKNTMIMKSKGRILRMGDEWRRVFDYKEQINPDTNYRSVCDSTRNQKFLRLFTDVIKGRYRKTQFDVESESIYRLNFIRVPFQRIYIITLIDLGEKHHLQQVERWVHVAQRLAHGIKNPLTTVKLNAEELQHILIETYHIDEDKIDEYFKPLNLQVDRLKKMADGFMKFVEFEKVNLQAVDLNQKIEELILFWQPDKSKNIKIHMDLEKNLPSAMMDEHQFGEALKNIFYNAVESMPDGGQLVISTQFVQIFVDKNEIPVLTDFVEVQIRDTGAGIPAEYLERITMPYFTRNKPDGTGLGLSVVKKIMDAHHGQLIIHSEVDVGTAVSLRFRTSVQQQEM